MFRDAAEGFEVYGDNDLYDIHYRERRVEDAYRKLEQSMKLNETIAFAINSHRKLSNWEKFRWQMDFWEDRAEDFYMSYDTN